MYHSHIVHMTYQREDCRKEKEIMSKDGSEVETFTTRTGRHICSVHTKASGVDGVRRNKWMYKGDYRPRKEKR